MFLVIGNNTISQKNSLKYKKVGFLLGALNSVNYFGIGSVEEAEENSFLSVNNKLGYQFGMLLKSEFNKKISLETGILFCRRNFQINGSTLNQPNILKDNSDFGFINYSFPVKALVYVQLSKDLYIRNSIGFNLDFYASAVASKGKNFYIDHYSERARWINGSISGNLGIEKRNNKIGDFYLGGEVNISVSSIAVTRLKFYYDGLLYDSYEPIFLRGNYFGIKFKYYLPKEMEEKKVD